MPILAKEKKMITVEQMCILSIAFTVISIAFTRFGTYPIHMRRSAEWFGAVTPVFFLILPAFYTDIRKSYWTKRSIMLILCTFAVCSVATVVLYFNKAYYWPLWQTSHWDYASSPSIRFDLWNIYSDVCENFKNIPVLWQKIL